MEQRIKMIEVLYDLIEINKDRVHRYSSLGYETNVSDLKALFSIMADESRKNITELTKVIMNSNLIAEMNSTAEGGKIYSSWKETKEKSLISGIHNTLDLCEHAESLALRAYEQAKVSDVNNLLSELIIRQEHALKTSKEVICAYRKSYINI